MKIEDKDLIVVIERKKIKNIYFRINDALEIYVTCPKYVTDFEIKRLLNKNKDELTKMYNKVLKSKEKDDKVYFLGEEIDYIYHKKVIFDGNRIFAPSIDDANKYLEEHSLPYFQERLNLYIDEFDDLPEFRLRVRKMKTRWGVCNRKSMTVTLNTLLIHKRTFLIDYVIVHELSHFEHMDHSHAFWECVNRHYPEYKKARTELKK